MASWENHKCNLTDYRISFRQESNEIKEESTDNKKLCVDKTWLADKTCRDTITRVRLNEIMDCDQIQPDFLYIAYRVKFSKHGIKCHFEYAYMMLVNGEKAMLTLTDDEIAGISHLIKAEKDYAYDFSHAKGKYAILMYYSWGETEEPILCKSFGKAWRKLCKLSQKEIQITKTEHDCEVPVSVKYNPKKKKAAVTLDYLYDDTSLTYVIMKLKS